MRRFGTAPVIDAAELDNARFTDVIAERQHLNATTIAQALRDLKRGNVPRTRTLLLPGWFPQEHRQQAAEWAAQHGWDEIVYDEPAPSK